MTSYSKNGYDVMNCFAKFEKFLPHIILIPNFMTVEGQMPELDLGRGGGKILGNQNTPVLFLRPFRKRSCEHSA